MRVQELLNKFANDNFLITVDGWCEELSFREYENEKKQEYWKNLKNRKIASLAILTTNEQPELCISLEKESE